MCGVDHTPDTAVRRFKRPPRGTADIAERWQATSAASRVIQRNALRRKAAKVLELSQITSAHDWPIMQASVRQAKVRTREHFTLTASLFTAISKVAACARSPENMLAAASDTELLRPCVTWPLGVGAHFTRM